MRQSPPTQPVASATLRIPGRHEPADLFAVVAVADSFFCSGLRSAEGREAMAHLREERALPPAIIDEDGFGFVGRERNSLRAHLAATGASLEAAAEAGLLLRSPAAARRAFSEQHGRAPAGDDELTEFFLRACADQPRFYYDYPLAKLADGRRAGGQWLTIPVRVRDAEGTLKVAGFQFRSMRPETELGRQGRYMSPRNTPILDWSELVLGLAEDEGRLDATGTVIICEGKFDQAAVRTCLLDVAQDQRPAVVALTGTEIRPATLARLAVGRVILFLDGDAAGAAAALKLGPRLSALGARVTVALVSDGASGAGQSPKDPGDLLSQGGPAAVQAALAGARNRGLATFAIEHLGRDASGEMRSGQVWHRLRRLDAFLPVLASLPQAVQQRAAAQVAEASGIPLDALREALAARQPANDPPARRPTAPAR